MTAFLHNHGIDVQLVMSNDVDVLHPEVPTSNDVDVQFMVGYSSISSRCDIVEKCVLLQPLSQSQLELAALHKLKQSIANAHPQTLFQVTHVF